MRKLLAIAVLFPLSALAGELPVPPAAKVPPKKVEVKRKVEKAVKPKPKPAEKPKAVKRVRPAPKPVKVRKPARREEVVLPAPEFLYKPTDLDRFEREKEKLQREKEILKMKVEIAKLKQELEKYELPYAVKKENGGKASGGQKAKVNPQLLLQQKYWQMRMERENLMMMEQKLSRLQNLFTGVMKVGDKEVAFDGEGRKYTVGSVVDGFKILQISDDGIVVGGFGRIFKLPISSTIEGGGKKTAVNNFQPPPPQPAPQPMPEQLPPPPVQ